MITLIEETDDNTLRRHMITLMEQTHDNTHGGVHT